MSTLGQDAELQQRRGPSVLAVVAVAIVSIGALLLGQVGLIALMVAFFGGAALLPPVRTRRLGAALVLDVLVGAFASLVVVTITIERIGS